MAYQAGGGGYRLSSTDTRSIMERCQRDPVFFARHVLGVRLWKKQRIVLRKMTTERRIAIKSCHGAGKTFLAAVAVLWFCFCWYEARVLTTAPTFRQVEKILWQEVKKLYDNSRIPLGGKMYSTQLKIDTNWFAMGFSTDDPDAFQGHHSKHMLVIFDEACGIDRPIWEAVEGVLTGRHAVILAIGNPTDPDTPFAEEFKSDATFKMQISAFDTPNLTAEFGTDEDPEGLVEGLVTREWIEDKRARWGEDSAFWAARVMGEFPSSADDALITLPWILAAQKRHLEPIGDREFGVDIARFGDAETVIYQKQGSVFRLVGNGRGLNTVKTEALIKNRIELYGPKKVKIDAVGVGGGVYDHLNDEFPGELIRPYNSSEAPREPHLYLNKRAEDYWALRRRFETGDIDIDPRDEELAAQLSSLKFTYTRGKNQVQIERKEDMRKRNVPSPDRADGLMIASAKVKKAIASREVKL